MSAINRMNTDILPKNFLMTLKSGINELTRIENSEEQDACKDEQIGGPSHPSLWVIKRIAGRTDFVYQILDEYDGDKDIDKLLADSEMHVLTGKYLFYHDPCIFYRIHAEENPQECDEEKRKDDSRHPDASVFNGEISRLEGGGFYVGGREIGFFLFL